LTVAVLEVAAVLELAVALEADDVNSALAALATAVWSAAMTDAADLAASVRRSKFQP
jgi:hypothetical protein